MSEVRRIVDQMEQAYRGNAWHGPSLREAHRTRRRPAPGKAKMPELGPRLTGRHYKRRPGGVGIPRLAGSIALTALC